MHSDENFQSTPNGVLRAHAEWLPGVQLSHELPPVQYIVLTAEHKSVGLTLAELSTPLPSHTNIDSVILLLGHGQIHCVKGHLCEVGEGTNTRGDLLYSPEESNFWSWKTRIDTLEDH